MPTRSPKRTIIPWQCSPARWLPLLSQCGTYWTWSRITRTWSLWTCLSGWTVPSSRPHPALLSTFKQEQFMEMPSGASLFSEDHQDDKGHKNGSLNFGAAAFTEEFLEMDFVKTQSRMTRLKTKRKKVSVHKSRTFTAWELRCVSWLFKNYTTHNSEIMF